MKYDSKIFHIIINHITSKSQYHIYVHSPLEQRIYPQIPREFKYMYNKIILRTIIIFRVH